MTLDPADYELETSLVWVVEIRIGDNSSLSLQREFVAECKFKGGLQGIF